MAAAALSGLDATPGGMQPDVLNRLMAAASSPPAASSQTVFAATSPVPSAGVVMSAGFGSTSPRPPRSSALQFGAVCGAGSSAMVSGHLGNGAGIGSMGTISAMAAEDIAGTLRQLGGLGALGAATASSAELSNMQQQQQHQHQPHLHQQHLPRHQQAPLLPPALAGVGAGSGGLLGGPLSDMPLLHGQQARQLLAQSRPQVQIQQPASLAGQCDQAAALLSAAVLPPAPPPPPPPPPPVMQQPSVHTIQRQQQMLGMRTTLNCPSLPMVATGSNMHGVPPSVAAQQPVTPQAMDALGVSGVHALPAWLGGHMDPAYSDGSTIPVLTQQTLLQAAVAAQQQQQQQQRWLQPQELSNGCSLLLSAQPGSLDPSPFSS